MTAPLSEEQYRALLSDDPGNPAFGDYAELLRTQNRHAEALRTCLRGISANPQCAEGRVVLARLFCELGAIPHGLNELQLIHRDFPENTTVVRLIEKLGGKPVAASTPESSVSKTIAEDTFDIDFLDEK